MLPEILKEVIMTKRGPGAGGRRHRLGQVDVAGRDDRPPQPHLRGHIITVEDPVEYVHQSKNSLVTHREVGVDTHSWHHALKNTLRQAPDVILIGEIRDAETMEHAIAFAETGHLCLGTLHANSANQTIDRIINFFPEERRKQLLMDLSANLRAIVSQRLVRTEDGKGRKAAIEILINTPTIAERIFKGRVPRDQRHHGQVARARHAHLRLGAVRAVQRRPHRLRGSDAQCRLGQRAAPEHQAEGPARGGEGFCLWGRGAPEILAPGERERRGPNVVVSLRRFRKKDF